MSILFQRIFVIDSFQKHSIYFWDSLNKIFVKVLKYLCALWLKLFWRVTYVKMFWIPAITDRISFKTVLWIVGTSFTIWAITGGLMMAGWLRWFGGCTWRQGRPSSRAGMEIGQRFVAHGVLHRLGAGGFPSRSSGCVRMRVAPAKLETNVLRAVL